MDDWYTAAPATTPGGTITAPAAARSARMRHPGRLTGANVVLVTILAVLGAAQTFIFWNWRLDGASGIAIDSVVLMLGVVLGLAQLIIGIQWLQVASRHVSDRGVRDRKWGPDWAGWAWFIPFIGAIFGFLAIAEIWKGTRAKDPRQWRNEPVPAWLIIWAIAFSTLGVLTWAEMAWGFLGAALIATGALTTGPPAMLFRSLDIASYLLNTACAVAFIVFIVHIGRRQRVQAGA